MQTNQDKKNETSRRTRSTGCLRKFDIVERKLVEDQSFSRRAKKARGKDQVATLFASVQPALRNLQSSQLIDDCLHCVSHMFDIP